MNDISELRICVEKVLTIPQDYIKQVFNEKTNNQKVRALKGLKNINSTNEIERVRAAFMTDKLWKVGSEINIFFMESGNKVPRTALSKMQNSVDEQGNHIKIDPLQLELDNYSVEEGIKKIVLERLQPIVNLKFNFINNISESDIRIAFDPKKGAWSLIGTDCVLQKGQVTMNLGWFDLSTTVHEFCHALGMIHEHQNPNGNKIQWNDNAVYDWAQDTQGWDKSTTYHNILEKYDKNLLNGSEYDPTSIMLYFFPAKLTTNNRGTNQNLRLSKYDVHYLNKNYPNSKETPQNFYKRVYGEDLGNFKTDGVPGKPNINPNVNIEGTPDVNPRILPAQESTKPPENPFFTKQLLITLGVIITLIVIIIIISTVL